MAFNLTLDAISKKLPTYSTPTSATLTSSPTTTTTTNKPMLASQLPVGTPPPPTSTTTTNTPKTTVTPSSPSATNTVTPTANIYNNGLNPALQSPAAQTYVNSKVSGNSTNSDPYASLLSGDNTPSYSAPKSAYLDFLRRQFDPTALETAQTNVNDISKRTSEELLRARKNEDIIRKNDVGQLAGAQNYALDESARLSNRSLADLALAKGVAVDIYNQMLDAGKTVYEAETAAQNAYNDQLNKDRSFKLDVTKAQQDQAFNEKQLAEKVREFNADLAYKRSGGGSGVGAGGGTYVPGQNPAVDAWVQNIKNGQAKLSDITGNPGLKTAVSIALSQTLLSDAQKSGVLTNVNLANQLLTDPNLSKISGALDQFTGGLWGAAATTKNLYNQLVATLSLDNRQKLKGQGQISDFEFKVLGQAATSLGRNLNDAEFRKQLAAVRGAYTTAAGGAANVSVTDPKTGESKVGQLDRAGIDDAIAGGYIVNYVE